MNGRINYSGELFATYSWDEDQMPVFVFEGQADYNSVQQRRRDQTIRDFLL